MDVSLLQSSDRHFQGSGRGGGGWHYNYADMPTMNIQISLKFTSFVTPQKCCKIRTERDAFPAYINIIVWRIITKPFLLFTIIDREPSSLMVLKKINGL